MDYDRYKLFVGGIAKETNEEALKQHFSRYGVVLGAVVAKEKVTGQPRGFGFVRFANDSDVVKALRDTHFILGRTVDVKKAFRKDEPLRFQQPSQFKLYESTMQQSNGNDGRKKIFVGGLSSNTTEEEFKTYFEKFGRTTDVVVMHDGVTNRPRGFGFVTFDSEDSVEVVMQSSFHELSDKRVEVKRAIPKERIQGNNCNHNNIPPTTTTTTTTAYSSIQATPYVPERNGYGMVVQQYPPAFGYHNQGVQGFPYPYGYQFAAQVPWNNPIMQPTGFYCPAPPPPPPLPYMNGFDLSSVRIPVYNAVSWPVAGDGAVALIPRFEDLKLEVPSQAHQRINGGGNMVKPLQNGTYR